MTKSAPIPILPYFEGPAGEICRARFWSKVTVGERKDCWDWNASKATSGYGRFKVASHTILHANRVALALHLGKDPKDMMVLHSCDRPECCNPFHLRLGTAQDNMDDRLARGRWAGGDQTGVNNGAAKLDEAMLKTIIDRLRAGWNNQQAAQGLPVGHALISRIRRGRSWAKQASALGWTPQEKYAGFKVQVLPCVWSPSPTLEGAK